MHIRTVPVSDQDVGAGPLFEKLFLKEAIPAFCEGFAGHLEKEELFNEIHRIMEWYYLWERHHLKIEPNLEVDCAYYAMDFSTIIRYVPLYLWWNNGYFFKDGKKVYGFSTSVFYHLATGGSIRKSPDFHPFTKKMAKIFTTLPFNLDLGKRDIYIYIFCQSLGASEPIIRLFEDFIRHPEHDQNLQKELDNWNPIVQKLNCKAFEELEEGFARQLLGYLYHCIRDKNGFSIKKYSFNQLVNEANHYYQQIAERAAERARRELERLKSKQAPANHWKPHKKIKPWEYQIRGECYKIEELLNAKELAKEGNVMRHCVGTYINRCKNMPVSIWSLRQYQAKGWRSLVTIEIFRDRIIQTAARFNARPKPAHAELIRLWATQESIAI